MPEPGDRESLGFCDICGGDEYRVAVDYGRGYIGWEPHGKHCQPVSRWDDTPNLTLCLLELRRRIEVLEGRDALHDATKGTTEHGK